MTQAKPKIGRPAAKEPRDSRHFKRTDRLAVDKVAGLIQAAPESAGNPDDLLTTSEVAAWLRVSEIWLVVGRGKKYGPPSVKYSGSSVRYLRSSVLEWIKARERHHEEAR